MRIGTFPKHELLDPQTYSSKNFVYNPDFNISPSVFISRHNWEGGKICIRMVLKLEAIDLYWVYLIFCKRCPVKQYGSSLAL